MGVMDPRRGRGGHVKVGFTHHQIRLHCGAWLPKSLPCITISSGGGDNLCQMTSCILVAWSIARPRWCLDGNASIDYQNFKLFDFYLEPHAKERVCTICTICTLHYRAICNRLCTEWTDQDEWESAVVQDLEAQSVPRKQGSCRLRCRSTPPKDLKWPFRFASGGILGKRHNGRR